MEYNFKPAFLMVVGVEGGYDTTYQDKGNWTSGQVGVGELKGTKFGIDAMSYPDLDIQNLSLVEAQNIYHADYWLKYGCDGLADGFDILAFDMVVNQGPGAIPCLERALGTTPDGRIGPHDTLATKNAGINQLAIFASQRAQRYVASEEVMHENVLNGWLNRLFITYAMAVETWRNANLAKTQAPVEKQG